MSNPTFDRRQLIFPIDSAAPDYTDAVYIVLQKLSETQNKPLPVIITALGELNDDAIRFRVVDTRREEGYIPLTYAVSAINGAKEMLLSAACSVLKPQIHHPRLYRTEAQQFIDKTRFRHTEVGSFALKVSTPVRALEIRGALYGDDMPFVRQTTVSINRAISKLISAIQTDTLTELVDFEKKSPAPELSSNLCKAVTDFQEAHDDFDLFMDFMWAGTVPVLTDSISPIFSSIKIQKEYFTRIDDVRRELKSAEEQSLNDFFMGTVEHLAGDIGANGKRAGEVILNLYKDEGLIRARTNLDTATYEKAYQAHITPSAYIKIKGKLHPGNQPRNLTDLSLFELILP